MSITYSIYLTFIVALWLSGLIGISVTGTLYLSNIGEGKTDYEKHFWKKFCQQNLKWFSVFLLVFITANYLIYMRLA